ncbi:MAG: carbon monoxide dehydrogenase maturation protein, partial [Methanomicrobiales archaeon]|nr:carbon monoxide dehydrogenase maturation protein [Methanomicrobiales archaeon]
TLGGMREEAFTRRIPPGTSRKEYIALRFRQVLVESKGFDLVAMGRPEGLGCYCFANTLLSEAMEYLEKEYQWLVVDSEAGMEHLSRRTVGMPDILLVTSDPSARGIRTADRIRDLAVSIGIEKDRIFLVLNRVKSSSEIWKEGDTSIFGIVPEDPEVEAADINGNPLAGLSKNIPARIAVRSLLQKVKKTCSRLPT